ncbi:MAG: RNA polymerase sigma factor [Clostridia bacterium]|nr:RNA polymerase sigma factor [Clostridia bacterium]
MKDSDIVDLYWKRDENAIRESDVKYGKMLRGVSANFVSTVQDAEECVNDTYFKAWNQMPTDRPDMLGAYLTRIVRAVSVDRYRAETADKRGGPAVASEELSDMIPSDFSIDEQIDSRLLKEKINGFLEGQSKLNRVIFVKRYFFCESIAQICSDTELGASQVKTALYRMRGQLYEILKGEGLL